MKRTIALITLCALALSAVFVWLGSRHADAGGATPWQVQPLGDGGSQLLGLRLGTHASTLGEARQRLAGARDDLQIAVIAGPGETGALEAYQDSASAGGIAGKLILSVALDADRVQRLKRTAVKSEPLESGARRYSLAASELDALWQQPITAIAFIPTAHLDAATVMQRFGQPAQRLRGNAHLEYWLYPAIGLSLALDSQGKDVLQYVAPAQFARLRDPLLQHAGPARSGASAASTER